MRSWPCGKRPKGPAAAGRIRHVRDITLGQYYPVDSVLHRMDPRTKLFGTLVYIVTLFIADSIWAYGLAALFLAAAIRLSRVPVKFMVRGLKSIVILLLISVSFQPVPDAGNTDL